MKGEKTVTGAIAPKLITEQSEQKGLFTSHFSLLKFHFSLKNKNLHQIKDKNLEKIVYFNNVHQRHAQNIKKHAPKETILQNINQT